MAALVLVAATPSPAAASPADYDASFGNGGLAVITSATGGYGTAVAIDGSGNVVVAGTTGPYGASGGLDVARFTPAGAADSTFGSGGQVTSDLGGAATAAGLSVTATGILVAASTPSLDNSFVLRYTTSGAPDSTFGSNGRSAVNGAGLNALTADGAGDPIVIGRGPDTASGPVTFLERLTSSGAIDASFGSNGSVPLPGAATGQAVAVLGDGHILAAGLSGDRTTLWRVTSTGALDPSYGINGTSQLAFTGGQVRSLIVAADGSAVIVERRSHATDLVRVTAAGALDPTFGDGGAVELTVLGGSGDSGGAIDVAGNITMAGIGGTGGLWTARVRHDGSLDRTFGPDGRVAVAPPSGAVFLPRSGPAIEADGKIVVAGAVLSGSPDHPTIGIGAARLEGGSGPTTAPSNTVGRVSGDDRIGTAVAISQATFEPSDGTDASKVPTDEVVLASADNYPDALVGTPFATALRAPLLLSHTPSLAPTVMAEIQRVLGPGSNGTGSVTILGGTFAISAAIEHALIAAGYAVNRIAGDTRYQTAVDVADQLGGTTVLEATGTDFPDGVTAGAAAAHIGASVLLTNGSTQAPATASFLQLNAPMAFAIGGAAASADPRATPIVGADRWETAVKVAHAFFVTPVAVGVATGRAFADALAGGSRAAEVGVPVLLTDPSNLPPTAASYLRNNAAWIGSADVFGGHLAVSETVVGAIRLAITEPTP